MEAILALATSPPRWSSSRRRRNRVGKDQNVDRRVRRVHADSRRRYGSIEPLSGKSYVQLEYEYAVSVKKPHFALVVHPSAHEARVKQHGLSMDERQHPERFKAFKTTVTEKLCRFWNDHKDVKAAIFQKLPEWSQRSDLIGWVRGNESIPPEMVKELAILSQENRQLREQASAVERPYDGLTFDECAGC